MNDLELDTFIGDNYLEIREIGHTMTPFEHEDLGNLFVAAKGARKISRKLEAIKPNNAATKAIHHRLEALEELRFILHCCWGASTQCPESHSPYYPEHPGCSRCRRAL